MPRRKSNAFWTLLRKASPQIRLLSEALVSMAVIIRALIAILRFFGIL